MNLGSRKLPIAVYVGGGLVLTKLALPAILTWLANIGIRKIPGYGGSVRRFRVDLTVLRLVVRDLSLVELNGVQPNKLQASLILVGSHWKGILNASLIGYVQVDSPRLQLNLDRSTRLSAGAADRSSARLDLKPDQRLSWQQRVKRLPASQISLATARMARFIPGQEGLDIRIDSLNLSIDNTTNSDKMARGLMAKIHCGARVMRDGVFELRAEDYPLTEQPTFNPEFETSNVDLSEVRNLIEHNAEIKVERGVVALVVQQSTTRA
jgi:hypothetical protein